MHTWQTWPSKFASLVNLPKCASISGVKQGLSLWASPGRQPIQASGIAVHKLLARIFNEMARFLNSRYLVGLRLRLSSRSYRKH